MNLEGMQAQFYHTDVDYRHGSPHLLHHRLRTRLVAQLRTALRALRDRDLPARVLEIGAGHGGYTDAALALGAEVTAVEMSHASIRRLRENLGLNDRLTCVFDPEGDLPEEIGSDFSLVLCASVLHHIPDYVDFLATVMSRLAPGGAIMTFQDPLWYARVPLGTRLAARGAYMAWRIPQGAFLTGMASVVRRTRKTYDSTKPGDTVEFHVVREGVDEAAIVALLTQHFANVSLFPYWSTQLGWAQRIGERLGWRNTFGVYASGYSGTSATS